ncbi:SIR2 family NAD-dependent protein deacylase [Pseudomonas syringae]|uniref:SIR2 family NAD-dependent protein deacylase n=1 Tax=Pseudomonas syringae TaxID=317 RepID=UPI001EF9F6C1|nr:Sir2 family NAD-dependent protein deacetylase [Pseudomonas syringae]
MPLKKDEAHRAIAELASHVPKLTVVTQNVDDLHERAGNHDVIHLHGSLHSPRCIDCGQAYTLPLTSALLHEDGGRIEPPRCSACNEYVRLGVVWFVRCCPRMHEVPGSPLLRSAMCSCRLVHLGLFTLLQSYRYVLWGIGRLSFTSILRASTSAAKSTFSKGLPQ